MAKAPANIRSLARGHTPEVINRLMYWVRSDNSKASVMACREMLDRGWGKPSQPITGVDEGPIKTEDVSARDELARRIAGLAARNGAADNSSKLN